MENKVTKGGLFPQQEETLTADRSMFMNQFSTIDQTAKGGLVKIINNTIRICLSIMIFRTNQSYVVFLPKANSILGGVD